MQEAPEAEEINMAFDLNRFSKYTWLASVVAFYQYYAAKYPDPWTAIKNDFTKIPTLDLLKTKVNEIISIIVILIVAPMVMKLIGARIGPLKVLLNAAVYYVIGDQVAKVVDANYVATAFTAGGRSAMTWGGENSAYHLNRVQSSAGLVKNIYGG